MGTELTGSGFFEPELRSDASFDVATSRRIEYAVGVFHRERRLKLLS